MSAGRRQGLTHMGRAIVALCLAGWLLAGENVARGDDLASLVTMAKQARQQFTPLPAARVSQARRQAQTAAAAVAALIANGTEENRQAWEDYLDWDVIEAELAKPAKPDLRALQGAWRNLYANEVGLEMEPFGELREALFTYMNAVATAGNPKLQQLYEQRMDRLVPLLEQYAKQPTDALGQQIGPQLGWLANAHQAPKLVAAMQRATRHPNLYADVSQSLVAGGVQAPVNETLDVRDVILGTQIRGTATMQGQTGVQLINSRNAAALQIQLTGTINSTNRGYNRGVTIFSTGETQVEASKQILLKPGSIESLASQAHCHTATRITGVAAKSCLIRKLAWRRIGKTKGQAERVASRHAETRVEGQMDEQVEELLADARANYQEKFRLPLLRRGEFPEKFSLVTTAHRLQVVWRQANKYQLSAPSAPPKIDQPHDLAVRLHESFVSNFSRALLGGVTLTDERLAQMLEDATGEVPEELKIDQDKEPWAIRFSNTQPVSASFDNNTVRFAIRGSRFSLGDRTVNNTLELSAVYSVERTAEGAHLKRQGDVNVDYVGIKGTLSPIQISIRTVMRKKFEAIFEPEFKTKGAQLPGRWEAAGSLKLAELNVQGGWIALAWTLLPPGPATEVASAR